MSPRIKEEAKTQADKKLLELIWSGQDGVTVAEQHSCYKIFKNNELIYTFVFKSQIKEYPVGTIGFVTDHEGKISVQFLTGCDIENGLYYISKYKTPKGFSYLELSHKSDNFTPLKTEDCYES